MANPLVTVLVDTYNHERFIEEAIVSVLEQDFPRSDMEILVVDDGSTDRTPEILRKFEPHVRVLRKANGGQASAFNAGIPQARGEIVAFLDGDDWWAKNKLSRVIDTMTRNRSVAIVGHGIVEMEAGAGCRFVRLNADIRFRCDSPEGAKLFRTRKALLGTSRLVIRRTLLERILPIPESLIIEADEYLFTTASVLGDVVILSDVLGHYRLHRNNLFQFANYDLSKIQRKLSVLVALDHSLSESLEQLSVRADIADLILDAIRIESEQIRLAVKHGPPWQTIRTEWKLLEIYHGDASIYQRAYTALRLLPAALVSSKMYYRCRRRVAENDLYRALRAKILPFPAMGYSQPGSAENRVVTRSFAR